MRYETIDVNDRSFELYKSKDLYSIRPFVSGVDWDEIYEIYKKPSACKVGVWHSWCRWAENCISTGIPCELWISGYTVSSFSIAGKLKYGGNLYYLKITKDHNRAYLIG